MPAFFRRISRAATRRLGLLAHSQEGFTIVEVVVSAAMTAIIAAAVLTAIEASGRASADLRDRSRADQLAQLDQERMQSMSAVQLQNFNQTRAVTFDGTRPASCTSATSTCFTVTSTGTFLGSVTGTNCDGSQADYVKVQSTVDWAGNRRPPVTVQSIITPPLGGTLLIKVPNETGTGGTPGATVVADGPDKFSAPTDSSGCAVFAGAALGDYTITASESGYVDPDGAAAVTSPATATASDTASINLKPLGKAGLITASFSTVVSGAANCPAPAGCPNQQAPSLGWFGSGSTFSMTNPAFKTPTSPTASIATPGPPFTLFPFTKGGAIGYTKNYSVWAGSCLGAQPPNTPTDNRSYATVSPGASVTSTVFMPALLITVKAGASANPTIRVKPDRIKLTDGCNQKWFPPIDTNAASPTRTLGALAYPGQPYAPASKPYSICAEYNGYHTATPVTKANTDFINGNSVTVPVRTGAGGAPGTCP
jgi:Tfp pilus assembly protein PilV